MKNLFLSLSLLATNGLLGMNPQQVQAPQPAQQNTQPTNYLGWAKFLTATAGICYSCYKIAPLYKKLVQFSNVPETTQAIHRDTQNIYGDTQAIHRDTQAITTAQTAHTNTLDSLVAQTTNTLHAVHETKRTVIKCAQEAAQAHATIIYTGFKNQETHINQKFTEQKTDFEVAMQAIQGRTEEGFKTTQELIVAEHEKSTRKIIKAINQNRRFGTARTIRKKNHDAQG